VKIGMCGDEHYVVFGLNHLQLSNMLSPTKLPPTMLRTSLL
jgi:hypothetical protein